MTDARTEAQIVRVIARHFAVYLTRAVDKILCRFLDEMREPARATYVKFEMGT
jgi:hypothetical protein